MSDLPPQSSPPATGWAKRRLPFDDKPDARAAASKSISIALYAVIAAVLIGVAIYMSQVRHMPLMSAYVIAPGIGAAWFGLRVFMMLTPRDK